MKVLTQASFNRLHDSTTCNAAARANTAYDAEVTFSLMACLLYLTCTQLHISNQQCTKLLRGAYTLHSQLRSTSSQSHNATNSANVVVIGKITALSTREVAMQSTAALSSDSSTSYTNNISTPH
eukprot:7720-Heterococcus_DN1.PRE.1